MRAQLTGSGDRTAKPWSTVTVECKQTFSGFSTNVHSVVILLMTTHRSDNTVQWGVIGVEGGGVPTGTADMIGRRSSENS